MEKDREFKEDYRKDGFKKSSHRIDDISKKKYEEYVIVLDFMARGKQTPSDRRPSYSKEPIIQSIGTEFFTLLEVVPFRNQRVSIGEKLFIGRGDRQKKKIERIKNRIYFQDLSSNARFELPKVIEEIITKNEKKFIDFFNNARPITTRMHQLELLPGVGKKLMWDLINERKKSPYLDFKDLMSRVKISDPKKLIIKRIIAEIENEMEKHRIFTRPYKPST
ncbi:MAG: DUF655 domain-containing protein [Candidatus Lokiarchaeota archaeon]|nr:DUF655 domain-containing protein [Candidatus Lokiarchaeota archaeon]